jgi:hypothetical protein
MKFFFVEGKSLAIKAKKNICLPSFEAKVLNESTRENISEAANLNGI